MATTTERVLLGRTGAWRHFALGNPPRDLEVRGASAKDLVR
ncbi:hypothetical protein [Georgenia satyanarayanai]|nr:hypothetical protein [Georgenia satyanarayanai]